MLAQSSKLWEKIQKTLTTKNAISDKLTLKCINHNIETQAQSAYYIKQLENGGCAQVVCSDLLPCGHRCDRLCHPLDKNHQSIYKCQTICKIIMACKHKCYLKCHEGEHKCNIICNHIMPCKHSCSNICHNNSEEHDCAECRTANFELEQFKSVIDKLLVDIKFNVVNTASELYKVVKKKFEFEYLLKLLLKLSNEDPSSIVAISKVLTSIKDKKIDVGDFDDILEIMLVNELKETFTKLMKHGREGAEISLVNLSLLLGELFKLGVIKHPIINAVINSFVKTESEECITALCFLLKSKGKIIYKDNKDKEEEVVIKLNSFLQTSRNRPLINSVLELIANNWVSILEENFDPDPNYTSDFDGIVNQEYEEEITSEEFCLIVKSILDGLTSNTIIETSTELNKLINYDSFLSVISIILSRANYEVHYMENFAKLLFEIVALDPAYKNVLLNQLYRDLQANLNQSEVEIELTPLALLFGELFVLNLVPKAVINHIIESCLNDREDCLEALCCLLKSKGREISTKNVQPLTVQVIKLHNIAKSNLEMAYPIKMMIEEVVKICNNNWVSSKININDEWSTVHTKKDKKKIRENETTKLLKNVKRKVTLASPEKIVESQNQTESLFTLQDEKLTNCDNYIQIGWLSGSKPLAPKILMSDPICCVKKKIKKETMTTIIEDWLKDQNEDVIKSKMELFPGDTIEIFISHSILLLKTDSDFQKFGLLTVLLKELNIIEPIAVIQLVINNKHLCHFYPFFLEPLLAKELITLEYILSQNYCTQHFLNQVVYLLIKSKGVAWTAKEWSSLAHSNGFKLKGFDLELRQE